MRRNCSGDAVCRRDVIAVSNEAARLTATIRSRAFYIGTRCSFLVVEQLSGKGVMMDWLVSHRADRRAARLADRHYTRQSVGAVQFVPPGRCLVLVTSRVDAVWVTSWPQARYVKHAWAGAWVCSLFRNEAPEHYRSSELIRDAVAATRARFGEPPALGMVTFVNPLCVRPKRDPGRCFRRAGFRPVGTTKGGLLALQLVPAEMPRAALAGGMSYELFGNMVERCVDE